VRQPGTKIVVTGGAGFVGSHLVDRLLAETRADVVVFDNLSRGNLANLAGLPKERRLHFVEGDVRDRGAVTAAFNGADFVYHLAAQSTVMGAVTDPDYTFSTNAVGTFNVLEAASVCGVGRLVFASSREVYGEPIDLPVDEGHPLLAVNSYGVSKVVGEAYCRAFRRERGLQTVVLRLSNVYGPRDFGRVIPLWLKQAASGEDVHVFGGKQVLDFIWVHRAVDALMRVIDLDGPCPAINVASGLGTRIADLARRIVLLTGGRSQIRILPARAAETVRFVGNVDRLRQVLQLETPIDSLDHLGSLARVLVRP
jgi:UDP-glucose 4-epimerase